MTNNSINSTITKTADEKIIYSVPVTDFDEEKYVLFTTKNGLIKRTLLKEFVAQRFAAISRRASCKNDEEESVAY